MSTIKEETGRFEYLHPLELRHIRLIQVASDPVRDRLTCKFTHVSLDNLPDTYKAISYCWGNSSLTDKVWLEENRYIELNGSAAAILRAIAAQKSDRYFWIDALCINQQDVKDKNKLVPLMGDIYYRAVQVIAWLGPPSKDSDLAIQFASRLHTSITDLFRRKIPVTMDSLTQSPGCSFPSLQWTALAQFLHRPWFQRMWIIQEVVLATDILLFCGSKALQWKGLAEIVSILSAGGFDRLLSLESEGRERVPSGGVHTIPIVYSMKVLRDNRSPLELHYNLLNCYYFQATNPRDNIWALLGMTTDAKKFIEEIDYDKSVQDVFTNTTSKMLIDASSLDVLHAAGIGSSRTLPDLPSWVPDWGSMPQRQIFGAISKSMRYAASGGTTPLVRINHNTNMMTLTGIIFDTISYVHPLRPLDLVHESQELQKEQNKRIHTWLIKLLDVPRSSRQYSNYVDRDQALWTTLTANISSMNVGIPAAVGEYEDFQAWISIISELASSKDWGLLAFTTERIRKAQAFSNALTKVGKRRVYMTERGYLGLGPECLQDGDHVVVFHGAATPFVVRGRGRIASVFETYALVGECYMHGLMNGECLSIGKEQQIVLV